MLGITGRIGSLFRPALRPRSWAASLSGVSDLDLRHKLLCITLVAPVVPPQHPCIRGGKKGQRETRRMTRKRAPRRSVDSWTVRSIRSIPFVPSKDFFGNRLLILGAVGGFQHEFDGIPVPVERTSRRGTPGRVGPQARPSEPRRGGLAGETPGLDHWMLRAWTWVKKGVWHTVAQVCSRKHCEGFFRKIP